MNKQEFLNELKSKLTGLPQADLEERLSFYEEMIDDRIEDGKTEEEAVSEIGSVDEVVKTIMSEIPLSRLVKEKTSNRKKMSVPVIILLVLGFPVWFPILVSIICVFFSLYLTVWILILSMWIVDLSFAISSIAGIVALVFAIVQGSFPMIMLSIGTMLVMGGLAVLLFFACKAATVGFAKATGRMMIGIKTMFVGKK